MRKPTAWDPLYWFGAVTLDRDVRIDDVEQVTQAIKMIRCVS
ncbi:hypothetical protein LCGC14_2049430, partial [marine sediment metagenome]